MKSLLILFFGVSAVCCFADPVAMWDFGTEETSRLTAHGGVHRDQAGPRSPEFPDFNEDNTAVAFDGNGARFVYEDPGESSDFDFKNGDEITIEAWVNVGEIGSGDNRYVIGKGRTGNAQFAGDNQNWALRIREQKKDACVSFLFATSGANPWHRWTTDDGFWPGDGWHHVAVQYRFGSPESIQGWIDGERKPGKWDMAGETAEEPVVDNDAVWIGSSLGGRASNSFRGLLDEVAVHRKIVPEEEMRRRFNRKSGARKVKSMEPVLGELPKGEVLVTLAEGMDSHVQWPFIEPQESARILLPQFFVHRLPFRYDDWGIRESWKAPVLLRMGTRLSMPAGRHTFLVRARGLSRLWVNGKVVAETKAHGGSTDGHNPVTPVAAPPLPGLSPVPYGDQERVAEVEIDGDCDVILESLAGGKALRPTTGSSLVAVKAGDTFRVLFGDELTDDGLAGMRLFAENALRGIDDTTRRTAAQSQDSRWERPVRNDAGDGKSIDGFLNEKIAKARQAAADANPLESEHFHTHVLPVLRENCFRCHGEKEKGDLRLNTREAALGAIVPGKPEESELIARITTADAEERMPPKGEGLSVEQIASVTEWIKEGAVWPAAVVNIEVPAKVDDASFLRRVYLDTVGVPPTEEEARAFLAAGDANKRLYLVDRMLADERYADHWVSYWQDVLAENPNMLKPSLNNSGPFRWFIYEALRDNKPFDRFVTELIMMRGSEREGGSAGFGMAADNDAPFAAKAHVIGTAFLGVEMQCARCHDSPYHSTKQKDLYSLAAMLERKTVMVPETSRVPLGFFEKKGRDALIKVTLKPDEAIEAVWPFGEMSQADASIEDSRARLAAAVTSPENARFGNVIVNRIWRRLMGAGFVEPAHDWEAKEVSHPELLTWLSEVFVSEGYDLKKLMRRIMTSEAYAREANGENRTASAALRFFAAPDRRRLSAEQVVDSLYASAGQEMMTEELTFDPDGRRPAQTMISLGNPRRAWELVSLSNERDRPSLSLPRAQAVSDVLGAFGWIATRQNPKTDRESDPNVLQPGVLANSTLSTWIVRASEGSELARMAVEARSPDALVESVFLRFLSRMPSDAELEACVAALMPDFDQRVKTDFAYNPKPERLPQVSWSNHLDAEANAIQVKVERRAREGSPADPRLRVAWREVYEDMVWSLINSPEFVWIP